MRDAIIRPVGEEDWIHIIPMMGELREELSLIHPLASWHETAVPYVKKMRKNLKDMDGSHFLAMDGNTVCGHGYGWIAKDDDHETHPDRARYGHIEELYIKPAYRKKGIASSIMKELIKDLRTKHISHIRLGALSKNAKSIKFYESCGFQTYFVTMQLPA